MERKKSQPPRLTSTPRVNRSTIDMLEEDSFYEMSPILPMPPAPCRKAKSLLPVFPGSNVLLKKSKPSLPIIAKELLKSSVEPVERRPVNTVTNIMDLQKSQPEKNLATQTRPEHNSKRTSIVKESHARLSHLPVIQEDLPSAGLCNLEGCSTGESILKDTEEGRPSSVWQIPVTAKKTSISLKSKNNVSSNKKKYDILQPTNNADSANKDPNQVVEELSPLYAVSQQKRKTYALKKKNNTKTDSFTETCRESNSTYVVGVENGQEAISQPKSHCQDVTTNEVQPKSKHDGNNVDKPLTTEEKTSQEVEGGKNIVLNNVIENNNALLKRNNDEPDQFASTEVSKVTVRQSSRKRQPKINPNKAQIDSPEPIVRPKRGRPRKCVKSKEEKPIENSDEKLCNEDTSKIKAKKSTKKVARKTVANQLVNENQKQAIEENNTVLRQDADDLNEDTEVRMKTKEETCTKKDVSQKAPLRGKKRQISEETKCDEILGEKPSKAKRPSKRSALIRVSNLPIILEDSPSQEGVTNIVEDNTVGEDISKNTGTGIVSSLRQKPLNSKTPSLSTKTSLQRCIEHIEENASKNVDGEDIVNASKNVDDEDIVSNKELVEAPKKKPKAKVVRRKTVVKQRALKNQEDTTEDGVRKEESGTISKEKEEVSKKAATARSKKRKNDTEIASHEILGIVGKKSKIVPNEASETVKKNTEENISSHSQKPSAGVANKEPNRVIQDWSRNRQIKDISQYIGIHERKLLSPAPGVTMEILIHIPSYVMTGIMHFEPNSSITKSSTNTTYFVIDGVATVSIIGTTSTITAEDKRTFYIPKYSVFSITNKADSLLKLAFTKFNG